MTETNGFTYPALTQANQAAAEFFDRAGDPALRATVLMLTAVRRLHSALRGYLHNRLDGLDAPPGVENFLVHWAGLQAKADADPADVLAVFRHGVMPWLAAWSSSVPAEMPAAADLRPLWPEAPRPFFPGELLLLVGDPQVLALLAEPLQRLGEEVDLVRDLIALAPPLYPGEALGPRAGRAAAAWRDRPEALRPAVALLETIDPPALDGPAWEQARQFAWLLAVQDGPGPQLHLVY